MTMDTDTWAVSPARVRSPPIIYGTAWKQERTEGLVAEAIAQGFRGIDTACQPKHYDEAGVGRGVRAALEGEFSRADLYLQTKFTPPAGHDPARIPYDPYAATAEQVAESFETSLANLQTDYVDSLVLHSPLRDRRQMAEAWHALEAIVGAGRAGQIGISNCYELDYLIQLHAAARIKPAVVQNRFFAQTGYDRDIRGFCRANGIVYQSFWTLTANPHVLRSETVAGIAAQHARTPAQVLFRYLTHEDVVPLTGTTDPAHMREDLAIFEFSLADDERAAITTLLGA